MKYETYANDIQIFGDDAYYEEWIDFIKSQGIEVDEEGCYEGDIADFMGAVEVIEQIVIRLHKEREELRKTDMTKNCLFDLSCIPKYLEKQQNNPKHRPQYYLSLLDYLIQATERAYCFFPYEFYMACKDSLEREDGFSVSGHFNCWKLKEGMKIHVKAQKEPIHLPKQL